MNIQTVAENLRNTIAGKEAFQAELREEANPSDNTKRLLGFLAVNLQELRAILADVEQCMADNKEFSTWAHWQVNPDRSGGQFTDEEIRRADEWR